MAGIIVEKKKSLTGHRDCIYTLERGMHEGRFYSASGDGMIVSWDLATPDTGHVIAKLPHSVYALHQHDPSGILIAGHNFEGIHLLDAENKSEVGSLQLTKAAIFDIQSHGDFLFVASGDGSVTKVNVKSLTIGGKVNASEKSARAISIHPEGKEIAVGFSDNFIRVYDLDLKLKKEFRAHDNSVFTVRYNAEGTLLFSGSRDARLKTWETSGYTMSTEVVAHMYAINHLDFSPDKKHFVTCSLDKTLKVWDTAEMKLLKVIDRARHGGHLTSVNKVLWTAHDDQLISASDDRTISVWHIIF